MHHVPSTENVLNRWFRKQSSAGQVFHFKFRLRDSVTYTYIGATTIEVAFAFARFDVALALNLRWTSAAAAGPSIHVIWVAATTCFSSRRLWSVGCEAPNLAGNSTFQLKRRSQLQFCLPPEPVVPGFACRHSPQRNSAAFR